MASGKEFLHHFSVHIGEAVIASLEPERQLGVIETQKLQNGRVQIVYVNAIFGRVEAELIRLAERDSGFDATAGQPHGEAIRVMVAAVVAALNHRRAAEFTAPDDERRIEQTALFQVTDQGGRWLIRLFAFALEPVGQSAVMIPRLVEELHKANAALDQSPSQ